MMGDRTQYTEEDWYGSFYELAIEYHPKGNDRRILEVLDALWHLPTVEGPWRWKDYAERVEIRSEPEFEGFRHLYGILRAPGRRPIGCTSVIVREDGPNGSDWLDFCLPTGMLGLTFPVQHPLSHENNLWLDEIDRLLIQRAEAAYGAWPFNLAIIGEEVSGYVNQREITPEQVRGGFLLSPALFDVLKPESGSMITLPSGLLWLPFATSDFKTQ